MKALRAFHFVMAMLWVFLIIAPIGRAQSKPATRLPVITNSYAADRGQYGTPWKIYLEAEAGDAQMIKIAAVVEQLGFGHYPTDFTLLKSPYRNHLRGYLQWNTFSLKGPLVDEGDQIILKISVIDRAGNESQEVSFPFTFVSGVRSQGPLPAPFDQGDIPKLGYISIDLKGRDCGKSQ